MSKKDKQISPEDQKAQQEMTAYTNTGGFFSRIPFWFKAVFIKYWTCGAVYFFVDMGLTETLLGETSTYSYYDLLMLSLVGGPIFGVAIYFFAGFLVQMSETYNGEGNPFFLLPSRKWYVILIDAALGVLWSFVTHAISAVIVYNAGWADTSIYVFREPFSWALIGLGVDMAAVGLKDLIVYLVRKIRHKEVI